MILRSRTTTKQGQADGSKSTQRSFSRFFRAAGLGLVVLSTGVSCNYIESIKAERREAQIVELLDSLKTGDLAARQYFSPKVIQHQIKDERVGRALLKLALEDENINVSQAAAAALGKMGYAEEVSEVIAALKSPDRGVRSRALYVLKAVGEHAANEKSIKALVGLLGVEDAEVGAVEALANIGKPAVPVLIEASKHKNPAVRSGAAKALGWIEDESAADALRNLLDDQNEDVRVSAIWAVGVLKDKASVRKIIVALKTASPRVRAHAAGALGEIADSSAVPALGEALKDEDYNVRNIALNALENLGRPAVPALLEALRSRYVHLHVEVARILGNLKDERAVPGLIESLKEQYPTIRNAATYALAEIGKPAIPDLIKVLKSRNSDVRAAAAEALGEIGDEAAREPLAIALTDRNERVRYAAAEALGKINQGK